MYVGQIDETPWGKVRQRVDLLTWRSSNSSMAGERRLYWH